jgi:hypothetical protein
VPGGQPAGRGGDLAHAAVILDVSPAVEALQQRVLREAHVPASIGVSLAKLASDAAKPFGVRVLLDRGDIEKFLAGEARGLPLLFTRAGQVQEKTYHGHLLRGGERSG